MDKINISKELIKLAFEKVKNDMHPDDFKIKNVQKKYDSLTKDDYDNILNDTINDIRAIFI